MARDGTQSGHMAFRAWGVGVSESSHTVLHTRIASCPVYRGFRSGGNALHRNKTPNLEDRILERLQREGVRLGKRNGSQRGSAKWKDGGDALLLQS